jgi:hypothetical protein
MKIKYRWKNTIAKKKLSKSFTAKEYTDKMVSVPQILLNSSTEGPNWHIRLIHIGSSCKISGRSVPQKQRLF